MKFNLKKISVVVALSFCVTGFSSTVSDSPEFIAKAEAGGILGNIGDVFGGKKAKDKVTNKKNKDQSVGGMIKDTVKDTVKDTLNAVFAINWDGMNSRRNDMRLHLRLAARDLTAAGYQLSFVTDKPAITKQYEMQYNILNQGHAGINDIRKYMNLPKLSEPKAKFTELMTSGDMAEIAKAKEHVEISNTQRTWALIYQGLAVRDATFILKETAKGLKDIGKLDNLQNVDAKVKEIEGKLKDFSEFAGEVKTLCDVMGKSNKELDQVTKEFRKKNNIKDPDKKEMEKQAKAMTAR